MSRFAFFVVLLCALSAVRTTQAQALAKSGTCPGLMTFQVTGATPLGRVAFIHSANTGSWVIPGGLVCFGTTTGLSSPVTLAGILPCNINGVATTSLTVPAAVCGNRFLQAIDLINCTTTNVVLIN